MFKIGDKIRIIDMKGKDHYNGREGVGLVWKLISGLWYHMHRKLKGLITMPSNNSKYSEEMRERTSKFIIESGKSATSVAEELGIDINTVCRWVRDYRRKYKMPSYSDEKGILKGPKVEKDENWLKIKELEKELKIKNKQLEEEKEKV